MGIKKLIPPPRAATLLIASFTDGLLNTAEKNKILGLTLSGVIGSSFDPYRNLSTAADIAASSGAMNVICNNAAVMNQVSVSSSFLSEIAKSNVACNAIASSSLALSTIAKSVTACVALATALQPLRSTLISTMSDTSKFSKNSSLIVGNGAGTFDSSLNTSSILIPVSCSDDNDTDYTAYHGCDTTKSFAYVPRHSNSVAIASGVGFRGVRLIGVGASVGNMTFEIYTAL